MKFSRVIGQDAVISRIRATVENGRIPHAFLFHGQRGTGKTTTALALARLLQCASPVGGEPCEACPSCHKSLHFNHPDIFLLPPTPSTPDSQAGDTARTEFISSSLAGMRKDPVFLLDESRPLEHRIRMMRWIKQEASRAVVDGPWKIFILKRAGAMNTESANAILKLLEEPNPNTLLILGMENPAALPDTIRSRCALFRFRDLEAQDIEGILTRELETPPDLARLASRIASGSLTRAASLLEEDIREMKEQAMALATLVTGAAERHEKLEPWLRNRDRSKLALLFDLLLLWYGDLLRVAVGAPDAVTGLANEDDEAELRIWAQRLGPSAIVESIRKIEEAREAVDGYGYVPLVLYSLFENMPRGPAALQRSAGA
jgi:DNA polymerase-3 subunit delta'